jgi:sugar O-acyltransferase (sialic acid O-acetyltransferase NeuD family)
MNVNNLIIIGASGFGREVAWLTERINQVRPTWKILGFIDDNENIQGQMINDYPVLGKTEDAAAFPDACFVCAIGSAKVREKVIGKLYDLNPDIRFATLIDPSVIISDRVKIGEGTIICAHTIVTVNIEIGRHVIINLDCTIGHDAILDDFVTLYPSVNVSGITHIGRCSELGTGMQIIQGKRIGNYAIMGAGSVVVRDMPDHCTAVGSPAKVIKYHE